MASSAHHSSSSSSSSSSSEYEVFLNFRGEDTRRNFTGHLKNALHNKGVRTFFDNEELRIGEEIGTALGMAIKQSRISIPIFSKDYASSKWCLNELVKILECHEKEKQIVLPIFFDVDPSEVRNQTGSFGEAFSKHKEKFKQESKEKETVDKWKKALEEVGKLKGWDLKTVENRDESNLVHLVVGNVLSELNTTPLHVAKRLTGINSCVEELLSLLRLQSMDRQYVGIWGMGGIGKTTLAKVVHNRIFQRFDGSCFLSNIREQASQQTGLVDLQKKLLIDVLRQPNFHISSDGRGSELIKERLQGKRVLLILDDIDHHKQLNALADELSWFGPGSRIIITTRDEHVLKVDGRVNENNIYKAQGLDQPQSLQLFNKHAFPQGQPPDDYLELSRDVVSYAGGLPLVLEVIGSFLCDREKKTWGSALSKFKKIPHDDIHQILKISYEGLDCINKAIFLDTACFYIEMDVKIVRYILEGCDFDPEIGLDELSRKSLVNIGQDGKVGMHDQLRDMGRQIVREESPNDPGERSRLWSYNDIVEVLKEHTGTRKVQGILPHSGWKKGYRLRIDDLEKMSKIRLLQVNGLNIEGNIELLHSSLRWLSWQRCPWEIIQCNFCLEQLVVLDLSGSIFREAWSSGFQNKQFENLKVLDLSYCLNLVKSPDFSGFPQLERLILKGCKALVDLKSIGQLKSLIHLDLKGSADALIGQLSIRMLHSLKELIVPGGHEWKRIR